MNIKNLEWFPIYPKSFKEAWTEEDVLQKIKEDRGKHFDPEVVDSFFEIYDQIKAASQRYPD